MKKIYMSMIGSRTLAEPQNKAYADLFYKICYRLACLGIVLRSGAAIGADFIAESAYKDAISDGLANEDQVEIFVPWKDFSAVKGVKNPLQHLHIIPTDKDLINKSIEMVRQVHPNFNRLTQGTLKLHSRNMNQVFGLDLNTMVSATICWTPNGKSIGGTRSAIELSLNNGIPVFNIGSPNHKEVLNELSKLLKELKVC